MSHPHLNLQIASNIKQLSRQESCEICFIIDFIPHHSLNQIALQRSAKPHLSLLLDRSHSMLMVVDEEEELIRGNIFYADGNQWQGVERKDGQPLTTLLDRMLECAHSTTRALKDQDRATIAHFSSDLSHFQTFHGHQKTEIKKAIEEVKKGSNQGTNMLKALKGTFKHLKKSTQQPTSVLLFTDGMPDANTEYQILQLAEQYARQGIGLHALGYGHEINMDFLNQITSASNGLLMHGHDHQSMMNSFHDYLKRSQSTAISDLILQLEFDSCLIPKAVYSAKPQQKLLHRLEASQSSVILPLGHVEAGSFQTILVKCAVQKEKLKSGHVQDLLKAHMSCSIPSLSKEEKDTLSYRLPVQDRLIKDNRHYDAIEMTFLKSKEAFFHELVHQKKTTEAIELAKYLRDAYAQLDADSSDQVADNFYEILEMYKRTGQLDPVQLQEKLNEITMSSSTCILSKPMTDDSATMVTNVMKNPNPHQSGNTKHMTGDMAEEFSGQSATQFGHTNQNAPRSFTRKNRRKRPANIFKF